jgi:hypothetical protein
MREPSDAELAAWADCLMEGCMAKVCRWAGTGRCYPHSVALVGQAEMDRRYQDTRTSPDDRSWSGNVGGLEG